MSDLISRDAVAKAVATLSQEFLDGGSPTAVKVLNLAIDRIRAIPATDARAERDALRAKVARLEVALTDMPKAVLRTTVCQGPAWPDDRPGVWLAALEACEKSVQAAVDAAILRALDEREGGD